jgi:hypothetical protein
LEAESQTHCDLVIANTEVIGGGGRRDNNKQKIDEAWKLKKNMKH